MVERFRHWCRRNPVVAALGGLTATLLLTLTVVSVTAALYIDRARRRADQTAADEKLARRRAQERLVRLNIVTGNFLTDAGDYRSALLRYAHAWMLDRDGPSSEPIHRLRLACVLGRCPRLEGICFHTSPVLEARLDASGSRLLTRTDDGRAFLWDPYRSRSVASPLPHDGKVLCAALTPDGARVVTTGTDGTARLWAAATGQPLGAPLRHPGAVRHAEFSPDGQRLATACADGSVRFWTVPGGKLLEQAVRLAGEARFVGFSPEGRLVVTVDGRDTARVWDAADGRPLTPSLPHRLTPGDPAERLVQPPLFSPDGARLLTADSQTTVRIRSAGTDTLARVWDAGTGKPIRPVMRHSTHVWRATFAPDGRLVVTLDHRHVRLWDSATGDLLTPPLPHRLGFQAEVWVSRDGRRIVGVAPGGAVQQWELPTFGTATDRVISLVQLLAGQQVDASDGIAPLEKSAFLGAPEDYRRAWLSCRGLGDDPAVPSSDLGEKNEGRRGAMLN